MTTVECYGIEFEVDHQFYHVAALLEDYLIYEFMKNVEDC